jgi:hypothetical protein
VVEYPQGWLYWWYWMSEMPLLTVVVP